jgi:hypothetical protein
VLDRIEATQALRVLMSDAALTTRGEDELRDDVRNHVRDVIAYLSQESGFLPPRDLWKFLDSIDTAANVASNQVPLLSMQRPRQRIDETDEGRARLVMFYLLQFSHSHSLDCSLAEEVAARIKESSLASRARGYCERFKANALLRPYRQRLKAYLNAPQANQDLTAADLPHLQSITAGYLAALRHLNQSRDPKTNEHLSRLVSAPLGEIENGAWQSDLSNLETEFLRQIIEETTSLRRTLYDILRAQFHLHGAAWSLDNPRETLPPACQAAVHATIECLQPLRFMEVRFAEATLDDYARDFLRRCEARAAALPPK